jgi:hypothetical protein
MILYTFILILLPFFIMRIRRETIETNRHHVTLIELIRPKDERMLLKITGNNVGKSSVQGGTYIWYLSEREMLGRRASLLGELARLPNSNSR